MTKSTAGDARLAEAPMAERIENLADPHQPLPPEYEQPNDALLAIIERVSARPDVDVSKLAQLLELRERFELTEAKKAFREAMAEFKAKVPQIIRNRTASFPSKSTGDTVTYDYATLDNVCDQLIPALCEQRITHNWRTEQKENGKIRVTCVLSRGIYSEDGSSLEASPDASGAKNPIQQIGSTKSYLERYTLLAACGVAVKGQDTDTNPQWEKLNEYLDSISTCPNLTVLGQTFKGAVAEAMALTPPDTDAIRLIAIAKDNRKAELLKDEPA